MHEHEASEFLLHDFLFRLIMPCLTKVITKFAQQRIEWNVMFQPPDNPTPQID
jgi:hypothetical protein